jgi:hypothetical protein
VNQGQIRIIQKCLARKIGFGFGEFGVGGALPNRLLVLI